MLVQEHRTEPRNGASELATSRPKSDIKINFQNGYFRSQLLKKDPALFSRKGTLLEYISENFIKLGILGLVFLSLLILFLVKNRGDSSALLCIQPSFKGPELIPFLDVEFERVVAVKDTSRFRVLKADKWIIVAASGVPTDEVMAMAKMQGWQVLAVGDSDTPSDWDVRGAIYLSIEQQAALKFRVLAHLPFTSHVRKSVGYLFAIQHGAKVIYDADEHASILGRNLSYVFDVALPESHSKTNNLLQFISLPNRTVVNPYIHFGQHSVWPRGLPLDHVSSINSDIYYDSVASGKQWVQHGLSNGLPDVDTVFYYTRKDVQELIDIKFDSRAPPVALPQGTMAPFSHFNTLFHTPAFWALMLPVSVNPQVSDVFRGFWAQKLLWEIGGYLAVYPPSIHRTDAKKAFSFEEEKDLHESVDMLINFLIGWSSKRTSFFMRVLELSYGLAEAGFWAAQDVEYTAAWLQDLVSVGYREPLLVSHDIERQMPPSGQSDQSEFVPLALSSIHLGVQETATVVSEIGNLLKWKQFYGRIVLILECSWPVSQTALGWRMLYGRIFRNVVLLSNQSDASFRVEANENWQTFKLLGEIFERYQHAEGFLFMKDNVVLNYWNLLQANKTKLWNLHKVSDAWKLVSHEERNGTEWYLKSSIKRTVKKMVSTMPVHFQMCYRENMGETHFAMSKSEAFYIPQRLVNDFVELSQLAVQAKLHPDLALPLFFLAMEPVDEYDTEAFSQVLYNMGSYAAYSPEVDIVRQPSAPSTQRQLVHVIKDMAAGDPLLQETL
ncbi:hypothetical protein GOP47_0014472 [Adiantum capillus-veneris]|uniref:Uncharacterized protein n=1 Tax=Adiantum capillus-veneris TaxID=13818 RepID=A0A9D4ULJ8_ADICA|nr:hypothetical protein GOP47_0014472 [Adiantum capillus-veneris]